MRFAFWGHRAGLPGARPISQLPIDQTVWRLSILEADSCATRNKRKPVAKKGDKLERVGNPRFLAKMKQISRNPPVYSFDTPLHADHKVHQRYCDEPCCEALADYLELLRSDIDPSVSDTRLDHVKTCEGSVRELTAVRPPSVASTGLGFH